jgi:hypothetical protein
MPLFVVDKSFGSLGTMQDNDSINILNGGRFEFAT